MTSIIKKPLLARTVVGITAAFLCVIAGTTFYRFGSSPTDENLFTNPFSRLFVLNMPGPVRGIDPPQSGDLLLEIAGFKIGSPEDVPRIIRSIPPDSAIEGTLFRPVDGITKKFSVLRGSLADSSLLWLSSAVLVVGVTPEGASDRAGMKVGDMIVRINTKEFSSAIEADQILRRAQSGRTIEYQVLRGSRRLDLQVTLARFGFPLSALVFSLSGFLYLGVGAFIALRKPQLKAAVLIGSGLLLMGYFLSIVAVRRDPDPSIFTISRNLLMIPALYFGMTLLWHSDMYFPKELPRLLARRWPIKVMYGLASVASIAIICALLWMELPDRVSVAVVLAAVAVLFLYMMAIRLGYRKEQSSEYRRQYRALRVVGLTMGTISVVATIAQILTKLEFILSILGCIFILLPLAYLYTIGRYRLLDMNLHIRRNVRYTMVSIVWGALVGLVFVVILYVLMSMKLNLPAVSLHGMSVELNDLPPVRGESNPLERFVVIAIAAFVWFILWRVRRWGQDIIDTKHFRTQYDYRRAARELAQTLSTKLNMADLGSGLVQRIVDLMQLKRAAVFFFREGSICCCREASGIDPSLWSGFCLNDEQALAWASAEFNGGFSTDLLPSGLKEQFRDQGLLYLLPIRSKSQLIGVVALGEKLSEAPYSNEDMEFLAAAASQSSVAIENAFLYEELAEKERLKHELEIARNIQLASLPQETPQVRGLDVAGKSLPAMEVGGDFFDYLNGQEDRLVVVVGDVSGKGTSAALYMSKVQGILRSLNDFSLSPGELFIRTNRLLAGDIERKSFVTALAASFDPSKRKIVLTRAGHLPLYRFSARTGKPEVIIPKGLGLGLENAGLFISELEERNLSYESGDVLLFVTDGITEARNERSEEFGEERLLALLAHNASAGAGKLRDLILEEVRTYAGQVPAHDDQTVVVVRAI